MTDTSDNHESCLQRIVLSSGARLTKTAIATTTIALLCIALAVGDPTLAGAQDFPLVQFQHTFTPAVCLQPQDGINSQIVLTTCNSSSGLQQWAVLTTAVGMRFINQKATGLPCIGVPNNSVQPGAPVDAVECSADLNQTWLLISIDPPFNDVFVLQNQNSRLCLTVFLGQFLGQDNCDLTSPNQTFLMNRV